MNSDRDGIRGGWATPGDDQSDAESAVETTGEFTIDYAPPAWYTQNASGGSGDSGDTGGSRASSDSGDPEGSADSTASGASTASEQPDGFGRFGGYGCPGDFGQPGGHGRFGGCRGRRGARWRPRGRPAARRTVPRRAAAGSGPGACR